jgi:hypothetical protein
MFHCAAIAAAGRGLIAHGGRERWRRARAQRVIPTARFVLDVEALDVHRVHRLLDPALGEFRLRHDRARDYIFRIAVLRHDRVVEVDVDIDLGLTLRPAAIEREECLAHERAGVGVARVERR